MTVTGWLLTRVLCILIAILLFLCVAFAWITPGSVNLAWLGAAFLAAGCIPLA